MIKNSQSDVTRRPDLKIIPECNLNVGFITSDGQYHDVTWASQVVLQSYWTSGRADKVLISGLILASSRSK